MTGRARYDGAVSAAYNSPAEASGGVSTSPWQDSVDWTIGGTNDKAQLFTLVISVTPSDLRLSNIGVVQPNSPDSADPRDSTAYGFRLAQFLPWLNQPVGWAGSSMTQNGAYKVTVTVTKQNQWQFAIELKDKSWTARDPRAVTGGTVIVTADRNAEPWTWQQFDYAVDLTRESPPGRFLQSFHLVRQP